MQRKHHGKPIEVGPDGELRTPDGGEYFDDQPLLEVKIHQRAVEDGEVHEVTVSPSGTVVVCNRCEDSTSISARRSGVLISFTGCELWVYQHKGRIYAKWR